MLDAFISYSGVLCFKGSEKDTENIDIALARFKRRFEVKIKYAPPFKMFLFISREASEKKILKKVKFSGLC